MLFQTIIKKKKRRPKLTQVKIIKIWYYSECIHWPVGGDCCREGADRILQMRSYKSFIFAEYKFVALETLSGAHE